MNLNKRLWKCRSHRWYGAEDYECPGYAGTLRWILAWVVWCVLAIPPVVVGVPSAILFTLAEEFEKYNHKLRLWIAGPLKHKKETEERLDKLYDELEAKAGGYRE